MSGPTVRQSHGPGVERNAIAPEPTMVELSETLTRAVRMLKAYLHLSPAPVPGLEAALVPLMFQLEREPRRITELADLVHCDVSTVSRQVAVITRLGLASKAPDPADGRALRVELTPAGHEALEQVRQHRIANFAVLLGDWAPAEVRLLTEQLARLADDAERRRAELAGSTH